MEEVIPRVSKGILTTNRYTSNNWKISWTAFIRWGYSNLPKKNFISSATVWGNIILLLIRSGGIASHYAAYHPQEVRSLALLAPVGMPFDLPSTAS